jgi:hypothetical protein
MSRRQKQETQSFGLSEDMTGTAIAADRSESAAAADRAGTDAHLQSLYGSEGAGKAQAEQDRISKLIEQTSESARPRNLPKGKPVGGGGAGGVN